LREALQLGHSYIGTEHILLGLLREGEGVACRVLVSQGTDLNRVRQEVLALMGGGARHPENDPRTMESIEPGLEVRRRSEELLRAEIESALTTGPGAQLLRRYAAGELSSAELSDQSLVRVLAESMLELQQIVRRLAGQIFPNPP
jgi:ATP-dependent Clp protease ATP-binding subunit ClpA